MGESPRAGSRTSANSSRVLPASTIGHEIPMMKTVVRLLALLAGITLGDWFPNFDQDTTALVHRSIVTHGPLLPLLLYVLLGSRGSPAPARLFVTGAALAVAVHLSFDLFPRGWSGFALIHLPTYGWTPPLVSWVWIAISIIVCFYIALKSARGWIESTLVIVGILAVFGYSLPTEDALWRPLVATVGGSSVAVVLAVGRDSPEGQQSDA